MIILLVHSIIGTAAGQDVPVPNSPRSKQFPCYRQRGIPATLQPIRKRRTLQDTALTCMKFNSDIRKFCNPFQ